MHNLWTVYRTDGAGLWMFHDAKRAAHWLASLINMGYEALMERVD